MNGSSNGTSICNCKSSSTSNCENHGNSSGNISTTIADPEPKALNIAQRSRQGVNCIRWTPTQ